MWSGSRYGTPWPTPRQFDPQSDNTGDTRKLKMVTENSINELLDRFDETQDDKVVDQIIAWYTKQQAMKDAGIKPKRRDMEDIDIMDIIRGAGARLDVNKPETPRPATKVNTSGFKRRL